MFNPTQIVITAFIRELRETTEITGLWSLDFRVS
jgi:hypothetical protein